jgi:hypothetical protein
MLSAHMSSGAELGIEQRVALEELRGTHRR